MPPIKNTVMDPKSGLGSGGMPGVAKKIVKIGLESEGLMPKSQWLSLPPGAQPTTFTSEPARIIKKTFTGALAAGSGRFTTAGRHNTNPTISTAEIP